MIRTTLMVAALLFAVRARHSLLAVRRASPSTTRPALSVCAAPGTAPAIARTVKRHF